MDVNKRISITKEFSCCYGHHLPNHRGKCKNQHGHNSKVRVTISLSEDDFDILNMKRDSAHHPEEGMLTDFTVLNDIYGAFIESHIDHKNLNDIYVFKKKSPTAENLALYIFSIFKIKTPEPFVLEKVRVSETDTAWAEVSI